MDNQSADLLIIGAGLTGLMLATALVEQGDPRRILLVDKGRSVGGRLATRRMGGGRADHGAQFFTVRDKFFEHYVNKWLAAELVFPWSVGWSNGSTDATPNDGHPRYAVRGGMNALAKHLAGALAAAPNVTIATDVRIAALTVRGDGWRAVTTDDVTLDAATVVSTTPVPQGLDLLDAGDVSLDEGDRAALARVEYAPCLCGLYVVDGVVTLPEPGAVQEPNAPITWIADNRRKGISPDATVITVHAGPDLSRALYTAPDAEVEPLLREALQPFLAAGSSVRAAQVKRWRYALPVVLHPTRYLQARGVPPLYFGGDAFGGPRVEGAALSGLALAAALAPES